jgi:hypothetical protein
MRKTRKNCYKNEKDEGGHGGKTRKKHILLG